MHTNCSKMMSIDDVNGYVLGVTPAPPEIARLILKAYESHWFPLIWGGRSTSYNVGLMFWAHLLVVGLEKEHQRLAYEFITAHKSSWEKKQNIGLWLRGSTKVLPETCGFWVSGQSSIFIIWSPVCWLRAPLCAVFKWSGQFTEKKVVPRIAKVNGVALDGKKCIFL